MSRILSLANYTGVDLSYKLTDSSKVTASASDTLAPSSYRLSNWYSLDTTLYDGLELSAGKYKLSINLSGIRFTSEGNYWSSVGLLDNGMPRLISSSGETLNINSVMNDDVNQVDTQGFLLKKSTTASTVFMWIFIVLYFILLAVIAVATGLTAHYLKRKA